jgi:microcystin-dependent protein
MTAMPPLRPILNNTPASAIDVDWDFQTIEDYVATDLIHRDGSVAMEAPLNLLGAAPSLPTHAISKQYLDTVGIPPGVIWQYAGATAPIGWVFCDGTSKTTTDPSYAALFAAIGYAYGGSGTSFNLPNLQGRMPVGRQAGDALLGTLGTKAGSRTAIPNHTHPMPHVHGMTSHAHFMPHRHFVDHNHDMGHFHDSQVRRGYDVNGASFSGPSNAVAVAGASVAAGTVLSFAAKETAVTKDTLDGPDHQMTGGPSSSNTGNMNGRQYTDDVDGGNPTGGMITAVNTAGTSAPDTAFPTGGVGATDSNLPPFIVVNFIIRIG